MSISEKSRDLVGQTTKYTKGDKAPVDVIIIGAEKVYSVITRADGTRWTSVRFNLRPVGGGRSFWTDSFPDEELQAPPADDERAEMAAYLDEMDAMQYRGNQ